MSTVRFRMQVQPKRKGAQPWWETYERESDRGGIEGARIQARGIVNFFNSTLRPHESPRELLAVELLGEAEGRG